jgi:superfamily II DNA or RNA helicase/phage repressor protein C with HTH and peptisase S24 domain
MDKLTEIFNASLQTGYVDKTVFSCEEYQPELLLNQRKPRKKVLTTILHEFKHCTAFFISVAFVTKGGVATLLNTLNELQKRGIKGQVLVSQYLNFTQPEALKSLAQFKNIDLRITTKGNAHAKGYIFQTKTHYNLIVGSSNLTDSALSTNKEWNIKVSALNESGLVDKVLNEFKADFKNATPVTPDFIEAYEKIYKSQSLFNKSNKVEGTAEPKVEIKPNSMQLEALKNLHDLRNENKDKALIISATGTGKTYLSAFDAKAFNPDKLLFVVHRLIIAKDALDTFKRVFGKHKTMGLYSGNKKELDCEFIFSTVQTISKSSHLENFSKTHFDYIIIDETHRSGANSYLRLIDHFEPKFLLGMTATPERTDGNDIYKLFDHNIAYEIRLNRAMEEEMLSSFHYFGVTDLYIDEEEVDGKTEFNKLVSHERVNRIIEQANFYGSDNGITRGLIFCSRKNEAIDLSALFNTKGYKTIALTGDSSEEMRATSIERLESEDLNEKLDYIFTVDIFNEGIDIPKINQIIMLRPTSSAIIFVQQLGRGLRKVDGKGYLTVIDFIGNYENNYLIPIALYGDTSYNKDSIRKLMTEGSTMLPGTSTINFDEVTKEKIFASIDSSNMQLLSDLRKDYNLLKYKLGRTPMMMDFIEHGSRDPYLFVNYSKSYFNFIVKVDKDLELKLDAKQSKLLELFGTEINNSKRVEESLILKHLIENDKLSVKELKDYVLKKYEYSISDETIKSCVSNLNFEFIREKTGGKMLSAKKVHNLDIVQIENGAFIFSNTFQSHLQNETFKNLLIDSTNYSIYEFDKLFEPERWQDGFVLYRKYSRKDVFRILNASKNPVAQNVGGYLVSPDNTHCPIFVNYHKEEDISESTKYEDEFVNPKVFDWMSKSNRKIVSKEVHSILGKNGKIRLPLFIKKNNDEGHDFYYMGDVVPQENGAEQTTMNSDSGKKVSVVKIRFDMKTTVSTNIYTYLHEKIKAADSKPKEKNNITKETPQIKLEFKNQIPLYNLYAAAGTFSEMQTDKTFKLIEAPENFKSANGYFACKVVGESMNRRITNGSICLFKEYTGGSRNGKIVLVQNTDIQDPDFNSAFTVKTYSSEKIFKDGTWSHDSITLRPNSNNASYQDIVINEEDAAGMRVVGEFVQVLEEA